MDLRNIVTKICRLTPFGLFLGFDHCSNGPKTNTQEVPDLAIGLPNQRATQSENFDEDPYAFCRIPNNLSKKLEIISDLDHITDAQLKWLLKYNDRACDKQIEPEYDNDFKSAYEDYRDCQFTTQYDGQEYQGWLRMFLQGETLEGLKLHLVIYNCPGILGDHCSNARKYIIKKVVQALLKRDVTLFDRGQRDQNLSQNKETVDIALSRFIKSDFFKDYPLSQLALFMESLEKDTVAGHAFRKNVLDILSNIEGYLKDYDSLEVVQILRGGRSLNSEAAGQLVTALSYNKNRIPLMGFAFQELPDRGDKLALMLKSVDEAPGYNICKLPKNMQKHKRVPIPDSPFWVSIDIITGEAVIRVNETLMYYQDLAPLYIEKIKEFLATEPRLEFLNGSEGKVGEKEYYYLGLNSLFFCQDALLQLKK